MRERKAKGLSTLSHFENVYDVTAHIMLSGTKTRPLLAVRQDAFYAPAHVEMHYDLTSILKVG